MVLKSLNKFDPKYGYPDTIGYDEKGFYGHQKGMCIAIQDTVSKRIEANLLPSTLENKDELLKELLEDKSITLLVATDNVFDDDGQIRTKTLYYLPYAVLDHSIFTPTINDYNIVIGKGKHNNVGIEILFCKDGLNRYVTVHFKTEYLSMMEFVNSLFESDRYIKDLHVQINERNKYVLGFYNEVGSEYELIFDSLKELKKAVSSVRLIEYSLEVENVK